MSSKVNFKIFIFTLAILLASGNSNPCKNCDDCQVTSSNIECLRCRDGYYINNQGFCVLIDNSIFSTQDFIVASTRQGVIFSETSLSVIKSDSNCWVFQKGLCTKCYDRFVVNPETNKCEYVGDNCRYYNKRGCVTCFDGFKIDPKTSKCIKSLFNDSMFKNNSKNTGSKDYKPVICRRYQNNQCKQCDHRYVLKAGTCKRVDDGCQSWNEQGICLSCFTGFTIDKNYQCKFNIEHFEGLKKINSSMTSIITNPSSISTKSTFQSSTYRIQDRPQFISPPPNFPQNQINNFAYNQLINRGLPLNCAQVNSRGVCTKCAFRYFNSSATGRCQAVSELCQSWSTITGACTSCYKGYYLSGSFCVKSTGQNLKLIAQISARPPPPINCLQVVDGLCKTCAFKFYNSNGVCVPVSDLCKAWRTSTGQCTDCFDNYMVAKGACVPKIIQQQKYFKAIQNCLQVNRDGACTRCANRFYLSNGQCVAVSEFCKQWNPQNGGCIQCNDGYSLYNNDCIRIDKPIIFVPPPIPGCSVLGSDGYCFRCAPRYILRNGYCQPVSDQCKNYQPTNGRCTQCYDGYMLQNGQCVRAPTVARNQTNTMVGCAQMDRNGICKKCSDRFVNISGTCKAVSDQCKNWNRNNGNCTECYIGYALRNGECIQSQAKGPSPPAIPEPNRGLQPSTDRFMTRIQPVPNCAEVAANGLCIRCADRFYNYNGVCYKVDDQCKKYDQFNGACLECNPGYKILGFSCIPAKVQLILQPQTFSSQQTGLRRSTSTTSSSSSSSSSSSGQSSSSSQDQGQGSSRTSTTTRRTISTGGQEIQSQAQRAKLQKLMRDVNLISQRIEAINSQSQLISSAGGIEGCLQINDKGACTKCQITYVSWNRICKPFTLQCASWDQVAGVCTKCRDGFVLIGSICVPASLNLNPGASGASSTSFSSRSFSSSTSSSSSSLPK